MAAFIQGILGQPYLNDKPCEIDDASLQQIIENLGLCVMTPEEEKGRDGESYTAAGLLERAAEETESGPYKDITGFLQNSQEQETASNIDYVPESMVIRKFLTQGLDTQGRLVPSSSPISPTEISLISPWLLYGVASGEIIPSSTWLHGILESVDGFVLIDPDKKTLGYLSPSIDLTGLEDLADFSLIEGLERDKILNTIGNGAELNKTDYVGTSTKGIPRYAPECPEPEPVESAFQFHVPNRRKGGYSLWVFGKNQNSKGIVGNEEGAKLIYPGCDKPPTIADPDPTDIPEPSLAFGLFLVLLWADLKKHQNSDQA
jgi:hypothetical protein